MALLVTAPAMNTTAIEPAPSTSAVMTFIAM